MVDLVIDTNSLYARAYYATSATGGTPIDAVRASIATVLSLLNPGSDRLGEHVDRLFFAWDGPNNREKHREPKPMRYYETAELLVDYFQLLFSPTQWVSDRYEADDLVATITRQSQSETVYVVSGDKDIQQVVNDHVYYYSLNEKGLMSARAIRDKWRVKQPCQVALALAILGDKVDCIQGIKGWGPKKVAKLFEAVTPEMSFEESFEVILGQIPDNLKEGFLSDLELTLVNYEVPDVPDPAPIVPAAIEVAQELRLPQMMDMYVPFYRHYTVRQTTDMEGDAEDVPVEH